LETPFLKVDLPTTFNDHPGVFSALLYTRIHQCNLNCYQCHNRHSFKGKERFFSQDEFREKLQMLKLLGVELIIVSGGEPTLEEELERGLELIKGEGFPVRLDTNGTLPERIGELARKKLIDGVALDVKIPLLDDYTPGQLKRFGRILFSSESLEPSAVYNYAKRVKLTIDVIKGYSLPYTLFRTVRYPLLREEEISLIKEGLKSLPYPHQVNLFYPVEE
jgi:pyruvate formate lyase activating enzyme